MNGASLRIKLIGGFLSVIALFVALCGYQVWKLNSLAALAEEQGERAAGAVKVGETALGFEGVYAHVADAVINRNLTEAASALSRDRRHMAEDSETIKRIADTPAEKQAANEFAILYGKYLDLAENKLLPLLRAGNPDPAEISRIDGEIDRIRDEARDKLEIISKALTAESAEATKLYDEGRKTAINVLVYSSILISLIALTLAVLIIRSITAQVGGEPAAIAKIAEEIAEGDLTHIGGENTSANATGIKKSVLAMGESLRGLIVPMSESMRNMAASSDQLASVASQLRRSTQQSSEMAGQVAAAAEEMQANMNSVATAVEETTVNVSSVAAASEELTATIGEIAQRAAEARVKSEGAVATAGSLSSVIANLAQSAEQIGRVTDAIADISEQTKLLALNATIEAARAGEAGKGFAVVATEIKELARQVATATGDISTRINAIRDASRSTREGMDGVGQAIGDVNSMVMTIASAVEEQAITVAEISRNSSEVSTAANESATLVAETAQVGGEVAKDVAMLKAENDNLSKGAAELDQSSSQLKAISSQMKEIVGRFKL